MRNVTVSLSGAVKYGASSAEGGSITILVNNNRQRLIINRIPTVPFLI